MLKDHELNYHRQLSEFDESLYMDDGRDGDYIDAVNMVGSMGKLEYGFYEMFKPIGRTTEKYIKVKMSTDGILDITGVVGLDDCEHWEWEHGSRDYLRSLNNGNQRYMLQLSRPINDLSEENPGGSVIWWKLDKPETLSEEEYSNATVKLDAEAEKLRYYKPYEAERMLRWFGTTYIPVLDIDNIYKCTVCSIPQLSNNVKRSDFHYDATNIAANGMDLARANIDNSTSLSLLTLAPKATINVENHDERTYKIGQFLKFVVSGNQQTSVLAFHVRGKVYNDIQEMNHYIETWESFTNMHETLFGRELALELAEYAHPEVVEKWNSNHPDEKWIPSDWTRTLESTTPIWWDAT